MHQKDAADALALAAGGVVKRVAGAEHTGVDAAERQTADERIDGDLERQGRNGLIEFGMAFHDLRLVVGRRAFDRGNIQRTGQVIDDGVEQGLDALVLEGAAAEAGHEVERDRLTADGRFDLLDRGLLVLEDQSHDLVVHVAKLLDEVIAVHLRFLGHVGGHVAKFGMRARLVEVNDFLHVDQIDDALERLFGSDGQDDRHGAGAKAVVDLLDDVQEVRADTVHLVDERDAGDLVLVSLTPHRLRLGLDAADGAEHGHGSVKDAQRALDFDGEVDVAGSVDEVDVAILPLAGDGRGRDRDAALALLSHPVHRRGAVMNLADLVVHASEEQDALRGRRLAGVDVGRDANVADLGKIFRQHKNSPDR